MNNSDKVHDTLEEIKQRTVSILAICDETDRATQKLRDELFIALLKKQIAQLKQSSDCAVYS